MPHPKRKRVRQPIFGAPNPQNVTDALAVLRSPNAARAIARWQTVLDKTSGPKQGVRLETLIVGLVLTELERRAPLLVNAWGILLQLPKKRRKELGVINRNRTITYRQVSYTNCKLAAAMRAHGAEQTGVTAAASLINEILAATVNEYGKHIDFGNEAALDGTVITAHAKLEYEERKRRKGEKPRVDEETGEPLPHFRGVSVDPDAKHGHAPAKNGERAGTKMGFEFHALTPMPRHPGHRFPNVFLKIEATPNSTSHRTETLALIKQAKAEGICDSLTLDRGYHTSDNWFHVAIKNLGVNIEYEPDPSRRAAQNILGSPVRDGQRFCPAMPDKLLDLPAHLKSASAEDALALAALYDERQKYAFSPSGKNRWRCPGDIKVGTAMCAIRGTDTIGPGKRVYIAGVDPEAEDLPKCCKQTTTTTSAEALDVDRQRHPYGTTKWLHGYNRRSRVEGGFAQLKFNHGDTDRHQVRMLGIQKYVLIIGLKAVATNIKAIRSFDDRNEDELNSS